MTAPAPTLSALTVVQLELLRRENYAGKNCPIFHKLLTRLQVEARERAQVSACAA